MLYRPDIEKVRENFEAFWHREAIGKRPLLTLDCLKDGAAPYRPVKTDALTRLTDIQYIIEDRERFFQSRYFTAESLPHTLQGVLDGSIAAFMGCELEFREETNWFKPIISDWESFQFRFDRNGKWWKFTEDLFSGLVDAAKGKYFVDIPDFQGGMDSLSNMRGAEKLCLDLYSSPYKIQEALNYLFEVYKEAFTEIYRILTRHTSTTCDFLRLICDKKHDVLQSDFLALITPDMAKEFVIPNTRREAAFLERSVFHLDGPQAVDKLDLLLEIEKLDGIQWQPVGRKTAAHWLPMLQKIQQKRKVLVISSPPEEVKDLVSVLSPEGLIIHISGTFQSEEEGERFVKQVGNWAY